MLSASREPGCARNRVGGQPCFPERAAVRVQSVVMSTLTEIEAATEALTPEDQRELFLFLAVRLREEGGPGPVHAPRRFSPARMAEWVSRDEADLARFRGEG